MRELELSFNKLQDSGVKRLCDVMKSPHFRLETLRLKDCKITDDGCTSLASALDSNPSHLRELDLSNNYRLQGPGVELLCDLMESPNCRLETLDVKGSPATLTGVRKMSDLEEQDRRDCPSSGLSDRSKYPPCFSNEPGPSDTKVTGRECTAAPVGHEANPSTSETDLDVSEDRREDQLSPDGPEKLNQQIVCGDHNTNDTMHFTPELLNKCEQTSYKFRCPGPGVFQCALTGLVFVMTEGAELLYNTVQWDESLLQSAGRMAAGPLYDIKCSEEAAVCQLHFPHCDIIDAPLPDGLLSVVHITDDGMSILELLEITDTHVVVNVPHLSMLGLIWDVVKRLWTKPVSGQILLFLGQPNPATQRQNLNVLLLPRNIPLDTVRAQHQQSRNIHVPATCRLIKDQSYTVQCPQAVKIQPKKADFYLEFGPNYHPTFEIRLPINTPEVTLRVQDEGRSVWEHDVELIGPAEDSDPPEDKLLLVRSQFVERVSDPVLNQLLDKLLERGVITDGEMQSARTQGRADKARDVMDTVRRKGRAASSVLVSALCELDPVLSRELRLM
ncbi:hypothetical protein EPR50_G00057540 [Perca flavescens]|uniref:CARD domain-containing protein n=1 Tax=Perca flavescens TaxID=8167 RepID=A0A484DDT7_PERFV|nr:hypothetical protein EPR50_G00057540 [Perca flavescens]